VGRRFHDHFFGLLQQPCGERSHCSELLPNIRRSNWFSLSISTSDTATASIFLGTSIPATLKDLLPPGRERRAYSGYLTRVAGYRRFAREDNDAQLFTPSRTLPIRQLDGLDLSIGISTSRLGAVTILPLSDLHEVSRAGEPQVTTGAVPTSLRQIALALGVEIDQDVVGRLRSVPCRLEADSPGGPSWLKFLGRSKDSLWSWDVCPCASATLRTRWVLVGIDQGRRRVIGFGVHSGMVDGVALCRMFRLSIRGHSLPKYLSSDQDPEYRFHPWQANLRVLICTSGGGSFEPLVAPTEKPLPPDRKPCRKKNRKKTGQHRGAGFDLRTEAYISSMGST
jgi:hypothetical protein